MEKIMGKRQFYIKISVVIYRVSLKNGNTVTKVRITFRFSKNIFLITDAFS